MLPRSRRQFDKLHARFHRIKRRLGQAVHPGRYPVHRRRRKGPGRRYHRPPRPCTAYARPRRENRLDLPTQHRREYGLPQYAQPLAADLKTHLQDRSRPVATRRAATGRRRTHRSVRLRRLAEGQQDMLLPA